MQTKGDVQRGKKTRTETETETETGGQAGRHPVERTLGLGGQEVWGWA